MPPKNSMKEYFAGGYYHLYNRGAGRGNVFEDEKDCSTFLYLFKKYLEPGFQEDRYHPKTGEVVPFTPDFVYEDLDLLAFCLMPTHFHLLVRNKTEYGATKLMRRIVSGYVRYFNERYGLSGRLFQGVYKAVRIYTEEQLLHVSRYIHLNPKDLLTEGQILPDYSYSSYPVYLGRWELAWLKPSDILGLFPESKYKGSYREFVEEYQLSQKEQGSLASFLLDHG